MKVLISGASGFIGSHLKCFLTSNGHTCVPLLRTVSVKDGVIWDPARGVIPTEKLSGFDAIIHLSGENVGKKLWNDQFKAELVQSRIGSTALLTQGLLQTKQPPKVVIFASAVGYYGNCGDETITEQAVAGSDFLAQLCLAWERASLPLVSQDIRVIHLRFGLVLGKDGGVLKRMLLPFRLCLGGTLGSGKQFMSWIGISDCLRAVLYCLEHPTLDGPLNMVSPEPVRNTEFTRTLGWVLRRPTICAVPEFILRLIAGEMADALFLSSIRATPKKLLDAGFVFEHPTLELALRQILSTSAR